MTDRSLLYMIDQAGPILTVVAEYMFRRDTPRLYVRVGVGADSYHDCAPTLVAERSPPACRSTWWAGQTEACHATLHRDMSPAGAASIE